MNRNIEASVGYQLGLAAHLIQNAYNQRLADFDLTTSQAKVLYMLNNNGDLLQSEIQRKLFIKGSTMNGIIDSLLKKELIEKMDSNHDRRSKIIMITTKGKELEEKLWLEIQHMDDQIVNTFSDNDKQVFLQYLKRVVQNYI